MTSYKVNKGYKIIVFVVLYMETRVQTSEPVENK